LFAASPTLAATKIYLGGRLVGRGKKSAVEKFAESAAEPRKTTKKKAAAATPDAAPADATGATPETDTLKKPRRPPRFPKKKLE
jgi:hypothetical protein